MAEKASCPCPRYNSILIGSDFAAIRCVTSNDIPRLGNDFNDYYLFYSQLSH